MIIKINKKNKKGQELYAHVLTKQVATLNQITFYRSMRHEKRHKGPIVPKVHTNRRRTRGRHIYYQEIMKSIKIGKMISYKKSTGKVIKHIQETSAAIERKIINLRFKKYI